MIATVACVLLAKELLLHKITEVSRDYGVSESLVTFIVAHESQFNNCAVGDTHLAKPSIGLVQISMLYNPNIKPREALDPQFALEYLASRIREGKATMWSTYRLYKKAYPLFTGA